MLLFVIFFVYRPSPSPFLSDLRFEGALREPSKSGGDTVQCQVFPAKIILDTSGGELGKSRYQSFQFFSNVPRFLEYFPNVLSKIIWPFLFSSFLGYLFFVMDAIDITLYADDNSLYLSGNNTDELITSLDKEGVS